VEPAHISDSPKTTKPWVRALRIFLLVLIVIGLLLLATYKLWTPRITGLYTAYELRNDTFLSMTPQPLTLAAAVASTSSYSLSSVQLATPWANPLSVIEGTSTGSVLVVRYVYKTSTTTGKAIHLFPVPSLHSELIQSADDQAFYGGSLTTNYALYNAIMNTVPSQVNLWASPADFLPKQAFLLDKLTLAPIASSTQLYGFETMHAVRGFEFVLNPTHVAIFLFMPSDREYRLSISGGTQAQVESILQSIQEISTSTPN
jgi:hypothetical protein